MGQIPGVQGGRPRRGERGAGGPRAGGGAPVTDTTIFSSPISLKYNFDLK